MEHLLSILCNINASMILKIVGIFIKVSRRIRFGRAKSISFDRRYHQRRQLERRRAGIPIPINRRCNERRLDNDRRRVVTT